MVHIFWIQKEMCFIDSGIAHVKTEVGKICHCYHYMHNLHFSFPKFSFHESVSCLLIFPVHFYLTPHTNLLLPSPPSDLALYGYAYSGMNSKLSLCTMLTILHDWSLSLGGCLFQQLVGCKKLKSTTTNLSKWEWPYVQSHEQKL